MTMRRKVGPHESRDGFVKVTAAFAVASVLYSAAWLALLEAPGMSLDWSAWFAQCSVLAAITAAVGVWEWRSR